MPCYHPLKAVMQSIAGKNRLSFKRDAKGRGLQLPCGRCIGCKLERARQWAVRITHEAKMHEESCFVTLTYDDEHLPKDGSLSVETCQLFLKRLRERIAYDSNHGFKIPAKRIRFFLAGEYGDKMGRPHYHAIIFGEDFSSDRRKISYGGKNTLFDSPSLSSTWGNGFVSIGDVSFDSACYVAKYATKKITGDKADEHYKGRKPEFLLMSRRPGIGSTWFERYKSDVFPSDTCVVRGKETKPPRYYDGLHERDDADAMAAIRFRRSMEGREFALVGDELVPVVTQEQQYKSRAQEKIAEYKLNEKRSKL